MTTKPKDTQRLANAFPLTRLAQMFGANRETMRKRLELVAPADPNGKGRYTPAQVLDAYLAWERMQGKSTTGDIDAEFERARKDREIANKYELANAVRRGELVEAADVGRTWAAIIHAVRTRLLALPAKLAPIVVAVDSPRVAQEEITVAVREVLEALAEDDVRS